MYYWIAAIGFCFIMKYGSILESFRQRTSSWFPSLVKLYQCCLCMGFWVGILIIPFLYFLENWEYELILFPFTCSCMCWFADTIISLLQAQIGYLKK